MNGQHDHAAGTRTDGEHACAVCASENPQFAAGERWLLAGGLTVDTAAGVLESSRKAALPKTGVVDLSRLEGVDSAAVAVLLAWRRRAAGEGVELSFSGAPRSLGALAELYGVEDIVNQAPRAAT